jgi:hypothetical protein
VTFYQEDDQQALDDLRRRNHRWMIGIFTVVTLMVASAAIGAAAAPSSHSHDRASEGLSGQPAATETPTTKSSVPRTSTTSKPSAPKTSSDPPHATAPTRTTLAPVVTLPASDSTATAPPANTVTAPPASSVTAAPASPAVIAAYIAAFRQECQVIWKHADADGLLWDPDNEGSAPHKVTECYSAIDPTDESLYDDVPDAQQYARDNADSAVEDMTDAYRLRSTKGVVFDVP